MKNKSVAFVDKQIILTMITCIVVAITVFAFRYKNYEPYIPFEISVKGGKIMKGEIVRLTAETENYSAEEMVWDFGDETMQKGTTNTVTHIYSTPGKYEVKLTIKDKYRVLKTIDVVEEPTFTWLSTARVGEAVTVKDSTPNARKREWSKETTEIITPGKNTNTKLKPDTPVTKTLRDQLDIGGKVLKNDTIRPLPEAIKAPDISNSQIEAMLRQVANGDKSASDFSKYMGDDINISVSYNGKQMLFAEMCGSLNSDMKKAKKIKYLSVVCQKDSATNCIKGMIVNAKKKAFINI